MSTQELMQFTVPLCRTVTEFALVSVPARNAEDAIAEAIRISMKGAVQFDAQDEAAKREDYYCSDPDAITHVDPVLAKPTTHRNRGPA